MMANMVTLPENWDDSQPERRLIVEGIHTVAVEKVYARNNGHIAAIFTVLDPGAFCGWKIFENFSLDYPVGKRMFKEFLDILEIDQRAGSVDLSTCERKILRVAIKHKTGKDGKVWANVASHIPEFL